MVSYNTKKDGSGTGYLATSGSSDTLSLTEDTTLYAQYLENPKITYDANGGSASDGSTKTYQYIDGYYSSLGGTYSNPKYYFIDTSDITLLQNPFTKKGYYSMGWATSSDAENNSYIENWQYRSMDFFDREANGICKGKTLYAFWKKAPTITYDMNGGSTMENFSETGIKITEIKPTPKYSYYKFKYWRENSGYNIYSAGDFYVGKDITLYAVWQLYGSIFHNKDVSVGTQSITSIGSFSLIRTHKLNLNISDVRGALRYYIRNSSGNIVYESGKITSDINLTPTIPAGTYTLLVENKNVFNVHTTKVSLY